MESIGRLVLVVGPSGAGKDTLIDYARDRLRAEPRVHFVRRIISRPAGAGEDHQPVDSDWFDRRAREGGFSLHWQAHGLSYGIPSEIDDWLERGDIVVANGSRAILPDARLKYPQLLVVYVTAPIDVLAKRLVERGRENLESVKQRLIRSEQQSVEGDEVLYIDNSGPPEIAGERFLALLVEHAGVAK